jgi:hypothetical protein
MGSGVGAGGSPSAKAIRQCWLECYVLVVSHDGPSGRTRGTKFWGIAVTAIKIAGFVTALMAASWAGVAKASEDINAGEWAKMCESKSGLERAVSTSHGTYPALRK